MTGKEIPRPVPVELWGKDHWSTLAYLETRAVDKDGKVNPSQMRCDRERHPGLACAFHIKPYPTRIKDGIELEDHDDWDCFDDAVAAGFVEWKGSGINPIVVFTKKGYEVAAKLREHRAKGGAFTEFTLQDGKDIDEDIEPDGPVAIYLCNKCGRKAEFIMYAGLPLNRLPCGSKCSGTLILQK